MTRSLRHVAWLFTLVCGIGCKHSAETAAPCGAQGGEIASGGEPASAGASANAGGASALGGAPAQGGNDGTGAAAATGGAAGSSGSAGAPDSTACSALSVTSCANDTLCQVLSAQRVSVGAGCVTASEPAACGTELGCEMTPSRATDPSGQDWVFPTTCVPAGWVNVSNTGTHFDPCPASGAGAAGGAN